jgi:small subunit ribosomal protein S1
MEENQINEVELTGDGEAQEEPTEHPMSSLMEEAFSFKKLRQGDIVDGQIVSVSPTEILVDVGAKSEGVVRGKELEGLGREGLESLQVGDELPVYVVRPEDRDGTLILSIRRAEEESDWRRAQQMSEQDEYIETQVAGFNKGGLIVRLGKLRGFIPASQLSRRHQGKPNQQPEERWARLVGEPIRVKIIEINRRRKRLILSERAALREWRDEQKERLLNQLREGEVRSGVVSSLADFGAFVDLGGADGLVHLSELSWNRSVKPSDVLEVGQKVDVYVLGVNRERKRIALSLKRLEPEPWSTVESRYYVGQLVEGTVTRLTNFGAFALINDEIEGLIHISELADRRINHPQEVVQEGETHVMRIIRIEPNQRRMGLSLVRVTDPAYAELDWRAELAEAEASLEQETAGEGEEASGVSEDEVAGDSEAAEKALEAETTSQPEVTEESIEEQATPLPEEAEETGVAQAVPPAEQAEESVDEEEAPLPEEAEEHIKEDVAEEPEGVDPSTEEENHQDPDEND